MKNLLFIFLLLTCNFKIAKLKMKSCLCCAKKRDKILSEKELANYLKYSLSTINKSEILKSNLVIYKNSNDFQVKILKNKNELIMQDQKNGSLSNIERNNKQSHNLNLTVEFNVNEFHIDSHKNEILLNEQSQLNDLSKNNYLRQPKYSINRNYSPTMNIEEESYDLTGSANVVKPKIHNNTSSNKSNSSSKNSINEKKINAPLNSNNENFNVHNICTTYSTPLNKSIFIGNEEQKLNLISLVIAESASIKEDSEDKNKEIE